jgi:hypothetical protein
MSDDGNRAALRMRLCLVPTDGESVRESVLFILGWVAAQAISRIVVI